ncbi:MAG: exo-alpha-sialidase [Phycisphaeraceae bacterium]|nr:exo-alpha-sialidase [Phycisphaeraceae bacterium]
MKLNLLLACVMVCSASVAAAAATFDSQTTQFNGITVPGQVIAHMPAKDKVFFGSPAIAVLPDGGYVISHNLAGPNRPLPSETWVYRSDDRGQNWQKIATIPMYWTTLFVHRGDLYAIGTSDTYGNWVICKSTDGGVTWTTPTDEHHGLLRPGDPDKVGYHTGSVPVVVHGGRIWRALEDNGTGGPWPDHFRAGVCSAPEDADLLEAGNWTFSNMMEKDVNWLPNAGFLGWLEGNMVVDPDGNVVNVLRVDTDNGQPEKAAIMRVQDPGTVTFNSGGDIIDMPGGGKLFTIRFNESTQSYWTLANIITDENYDPNVKANRIRDILALLESKDLRRWEIRRELLKDTSDVKNIGFHYSNWHFDGRDIIGVARTAYPDGEGGAARYHDANFFNFYRFPNVIPAAE